MATESYRTYTFVVKVPDDLTQDERDFYTDDPRPLLNDNDKVMFWGMEGGITQAALDLGADPTSWEE